ncbi:hypothetical protein AGLY_003933, partial [Aphis glycines]
MVKDDLERAAREMLQKLIIEYDCKIQLFLSNRHKGIQYFFRIQHPEINHDKSKNKFLSILYHIANIHEWVDEMQCEHEKLTDEQVKNKLWIHTETSSYDAIKKILIAKDFIKDLRQAKYFVHIGKLESYHNLRLKFMPKRIHLKFNGEKVVFSKPLRRFTIKNSYDKTQNNWKHGIMTKIIEEANKEILPQQFDVQKECNTNIPKNIYPTFRPPYEELKSKSMFFFFVSVYSITSRNNASISNFGGGFQWKSEYPWCIKCKNSFFTKSVENAKICKLI